MKRHLSRPALAVLLVFLSGACGRDEVTGVPGLTARTDASGSTLRNVILFSTEQPGSQTQLAIVNPDGTGRALVTNDQQHAYLYPAISPDGRRIAVVRFTPDNTPEGLFLMNADGTDQRLLVNRSAVIDAQPAWSPDGSQIAFQSFDEGPFGPLARIYVINVDGTALRQLSPPIDEEHDFAFDEGPTWSPDGTRLAFTRNAQLYLINADGTGFTAVPNEDLAQGASWSPDGTRIAYMSQIPFGDIHIRNIDGSNLVAVTTNAQQENSPSWSADGRRLVFERVIAGRFKLVVINADGTGEARLSFETSDFFPNWSRFPLAPSGAGASISIAPTTTKLAPSESRQLTASVRTASGNVLDHPPVQWSSTDPSIVTVTASGLVTGIDNGTALIRAVFRGDTARAEVRVVDRVLRNAILYATDEFGFPELAVVRPDGTGRHRLTVDEIGYGSPDISPDGRRILFTTIFSIFVMNADVQAVTEGASEVFHSFNGHLASPSWSPDGSQIAFRSDADSPSGLVDRIFVINADGSGLRQLTPDDPANDDSPTWSPDGTRIIFTRNNGLQVINVDGTGLTALPNEDLSASPDWSPDGTRVAYGSPAGGIRIRNADGSRLVTVTTGQDSHPRWSPDSRRLVFARVADGRSQLFTVNADGTGERQLSTGPASESDPSWSPVP